MKTHLIRSTAVALVLAYSFTLGACSLPPINSTPPASGTTPPTAAVGGTVVSNPGTVVATTTVTVNDAFLNDLVGILNVSGPDIQNAENAMNMVLPSTGAKLNPDMAECDAAILTIDSDVKAISVQAGSGANGAVTAISLAETVQPNGQVYNNEKKILVGGCVLAAVDTLTAQGQIATADAAAVFAVNNLGEIVPMLALAIPK